MWSSLDGLLTNALTCAISSKQLKIYFLASFDLIPVSASWSSGVCSKQETGIDQNCPAISCGLCATSSFSLILPSSETTVSLLPDQVTFTLSPLRLYDSFFVTRWFISFFFTSEDLPNYGVSPKGLLRPPQREAQHPILTARSPLASLLGDRMQPNVLVQETRGSLQLLSVLIVRIKMLSVVWLVCLFGFFFPPRC